MSTTGRKITEGEQRDWLRLFESSGGRPGKLTGREPSCSDMDAWRDFIGDSPSKSEASPVSTRCDDPASSEVKARASHAAERRPKPVVYPFFKLDRQTRRRLASRRQRPEQVLDLHGSTVSEAHERVRNFIISSVDQRLSLILVITGKGRSGTGVLRQQFPNWINDPSLSRWVVSVAPALPHHGGKGAYYVFLRQRKTQ